MKSDEVFEAHIWSKLRMRAVNLFLFPCICRWPRHGETQKDLTFVSSSVIRKMGKSLEAACKLGNFLFVQEDFALTPAPMAADWREESKLPYFQFFNFSWISLSWLELECLSQRLSHHSMRFLESGINIVCKDCHNYLLWAPPKPIVPLHYPETWSSSKRFAFCNTVKFWILFCIGHHDNKYIWVCFNAIASASCWYETKGEI